MFPGKKRPCPVFLYPLSMALKIPHPPDPDTVQIQNEIHDFFLTKRPIQDIFHITLTYKKEWTRT